MKKILLITFFILLISIGTLLTTLYLRYPSSEKNFIVEVRIDHNGHSYSAKAIQNWL